MIHPELFKRVQALAVENSPVLLTGVGVVGTFTTAVLTGRASFKAARIIQEEESKMDGDIPVHTMDLTTGDKLKFVWPEFIPPVGVGAVTIASIIFANRISTGRAAAMAAAYGLSEKTFQEYKDKVVEKIGVNKETDIRDAAAQDRINNNPPSANSVIVTGTGKVLCFDTLSGRYFESSVEAIRRAENEVNFDIVHHSYASLSKFYDEIGLRPTPFSEEIGWNLDHRCDVQFSTVMSEENQPCVAIEFADWPKEDYTKTWG